MSRLEPKSSSLSEETSLGPSLLGNLFETAPVGIVITGPHGRVIRANQGFLDMFRFSRQEIEGQVLDQKILPEEEFEVGREKSRETDRGEQIRFEARRKRGDGSIFLASVFASPLWIDGHVEGYYGAYQDITARRRAETAQSVLLALSEATQTVGSLEALYHSIHEIIQNILPAENLYIAMLDDSDSRLEFPYFVDACESNPGPQELGRGLTEYVLRTGKPLLATPETFKSLMASGEVESIGPPSVDWLGVPLRIGHKVQGVLAVQSYKKGVRYTEDDLALLTFLTGQVALAIERKRAQDDLQESQELYRTLVQTSPSAVTATDLKGNITYASPKTLELHGFKKSEDLLGRSAFTLLAPEEHERALENLHQTLDRGYSGEMEYVMLKKDKTRFTGELSAALIKDSTGTAKAFIAAVRDVSHRKEAERRLQESELKYRTMVEKSIQGIVIIQDNRIVYANRALCRIFGYNKRELLALNPKSLKSLIHPEDRGMVWGRLLSRLEGKRVPSRYELRIIRKDGAEVWIDMMASVVDHRGHPAVHAALVDISDRKRAEEDQKISQKKIRASLEKTVKALVSAFELRDPYTTGHQQRVSSLACAIAEEVGLSADRIQGLRLAGDIHDIGKIQIPTEILTKPGRLSSIEFDLIKLHSRAGYEILKGIEFPHPVARMVLEHHERIDGSGYPQGLHEADILLEAKILAVADVVEAMASARPYRPSLGLETALQEIEANAGRLYDPDIAKACLDLFRKKSFSFDSAEDGRRRSE